jgi:hypothetical protein
MSSRLVRGGSFSPGMGLPTAVDPGAGAPRAGVPLGRLIGRQRALSYGRSRVMDYGFAQPGWLLVGLCRFVGSRHRNGHLL